MLPSLGSLQEMAVGFRQEFAGAEFLLRDRTKGDNVSKSFLILSILCFHTLSYAQTVVPSAPAPVLPEAPRAELAAVSTPLFHSARLSDILRTLPATDSPVATLPAVASLVGVRLKIKLVHAVSSKMVNGTAIQAILEQPVLQHGDVILSGDILFEGHLVTKPAGHFMRPGSMLVVFDRLVLPGGDVQNVNLNLISAGSTNVKSDSEGMLHSSISKKRLAIQLGGTALTAKFADDLAELPGGTAVGAGTARFVGAGAAATFFALQKGREVKLNAGAELEVEFGRDGNALRNVSLGSR